MGDSTEDNEVKMDESLDKVGIIETVSDVNGDGAIENVSGTSYLGDSDIEAVEVLEQIWVGSETDPVVSETNRFKSKNIYDKQSQTQLKDDNTTMETNVGSEYRVEHYLTHGIFMIVLIMCCLLVISKMVRRTQRSSKICVSQEMAKDLGYTKLDGIKEEKENVQYMTQFRNMYKMQ